jgi:hypothetical protein
VDRWLRWDQATGADGCRLELLPGQQPPGGLVSYEVRVATSDVRGAGTDADISITLYGDRGDSGPLALASSANDFERGRTDTFFVKVGCWQGCSLRTSPGTAGGRCFDPPTCARECGLCCTHQPRWPLQGIDIGSISHVRVCSSGTGLGPAWHLASVTVTHTGSGQEMAFKHGGWLDQQHGLEVLLWPVGSLQAAQAAPPPDVEYQVEVHTSDVRSARLPSWLAPQCFAVARQPSSCAWRE